MEELRQRNTFNSNNNDDDNMNPFAPAEEFQEQQQRYTPQLPSPTRFQTLLKQADRSWRDLQSRYTFLEGGTVNNGIDKRIPVVFHPWIVRYKYYKMPIYVTVFFMILILTAYSVRHAYVQRSLQLHIRENEMLDWEGNRFENGFDLKSLETSTPYQYTLTKSDFDLWILNEQKKENQQEEVVTTMMTEEDIIVTTIEEAEELDKKKKFINRFTDKEFENGYFESKVFLGATLLKSASETPLPHNISMLNVNEALKDRCSNPEKCDCISLLQLGIPRNVILIFDHDTKEYNILYDPEIAGQSATRTTFKYYMNEEQEIHDKHKEIIAQSKGKRVTVITDVNNAKKKPAATTTAVNSAMYFRMNVPTSILVQYKKTENRGKISREQFSGGASACICNILRIEADYSSYLKEIEETEEIKF